MMVAMKAIRYLAYCGVTLALIGGPVSAQPTAASRPNILIAIADDWGWPHASAYGDPVVKTPTLDRLAREGVLFDHAYVGLPVVHTEPGGPPDRPVALAARGKRQPVEHPPVRPTRPIRNCSSGRVTTWA